MGQAGPDGRTAASLAEKLAEWGNTALSEKERAILLTLAWRHADPLDRVRARREDLLDEGEEALVRALEVEFGGPQ